MPVTKNQFLRQEILIGLLSRNSFTRSELLEKLNEKLEKSMIGAVHWKTLHNDLIGLENLGASIHRPATGDNRYYFSESYMPDGTGLTGEDIATLENALQILNGLTAFTVAREVSGILSRLKSTRHLVNLNPRHYISFEDHTQADGVLHLDDLMEAIGNRIVLSVHYQPFYKEEANIQFHPCFLKEYRNRWFVFGLDQLQNRTVSLALDRIESVKPMLDEIYRENDLFDPEAYFTNMIGVSLPTHAKPEKIRLKVFRKSAMHVETKKIHHSQRIVSRNDDGSIEIELTVVVNYELISTILGFGAAVKVLDPEGVVRKIKSILLEVSDFYLP
jgi:predicted DNA-binding transcriptional regulator YafY